MRRPRRASSPKQGLATIDQDCQQWQRVACHGHIRQRPHRLGVHQRQCDRPGLGSQNHQRPAQPGSHLYLVQQQRCHQRRGGVGTATGGTCATTGRCDTEKFVSDVNAAGLCGAADWRMPTKPELVSIVDYGIASPGPTIDTTWFPNTIASYFWSASAGSGYSNDAWLVNFDSGYADGSVSKSSSSRVRLVRTGQ